MMHGMVSEAERRRIGVLIRHRRQVLGLTQPEFAERVGVSRQAVSKWETGQSYPLRWAGKIEAVLAPFSLSEPDGMEPRDEYEAELLSLKHLPPGEAERLIELYRAQADRPRRAG